MNIVPSPAHLILSRDEGVSHTERGWRDGSLVRMFRGVYVEREIWSELAPWQKQLVRVHAAIAAHPDRVICNESAATLLGVLIAHPSRPVHVLTEGGASREYRGIRSHVGVDPRELLEIDGIRLTDPAATAVDIARSRPPAEALAYADALLRIAPEPHDGTWAALNESMASSRGRRQARWALNHATGIPESVLESASLAVIEWLGYKAPVPQQTFQFEGHTDRGDFYWPDENVLGEADGRVKYTDELGDPTNAIVTEKSRENRLRRHLDGLARWGWEELDEAELLDAALRGIGLRPVRPRDTLRLATFRRLGR